MLFSNLTPSTLEILAGKGVKNVIPTGQVVQVGSKSLGFINVVLSGSVGVEYSGFSLYGANNTLNETKFFGSIDTVLGIGKFTQMKSLVETQLFSIHRNEVRKLLEDYSDFKTHLFNMRMAIALRVAELHQKKIAPVAPEPGIWNRVAPRFSVWERSMFVQMSTGEVLKIENISATGLYIKGTLTAPVKSEISFLIKSKEKPLPTTQFKAYITRKDSDGVGITLAQIDTQIKLVWEDIVLQVMSIEIAEIFQPELKRLPSPIPGLISYNQKPSRCEVVSLSTEGALIKYPDTPPKENFTLTLNLTLKNSAQTNLNLMCKIMAAKDREYLVQFINILPVQEDWIQQAISVASTPSPVKKPTAIPPRVASPIPPTPSLPKPSPSTSPSAPPTAPTSPVKNEKRPEVIKVDSQQTLNFLFIREISDNKLILYSNLNYSVGDPVKIVVRLLFTPRAEFRSTSFDFSGIVKEINKGNAIVYLDASSFPTIGELKKLVSTSNQKNMERDFNTQIHYEHNIEYRRYIQFFLIAILLAACAWWCYSTIFHEGPQEIIPN